MEKRAEVFQFTSYQFDPQNRRAVFHYATRLRQGSGGQAKLIHWTETIIFPKVPNLKNIPKETITKLLESLHIILGISYYKFYCPPRIKLPYTLTKQEADFWNTIYKKGLGEFFYRNKLDPKISPKFSFNKNKKPTSYSLLTTHSKCLVGIGGGKDSIVVAELLKQRGFDITAFTAETAESPLVKKVIDVMNVGSLSIVRQLDPKVHDKHPHNGHIPVSAIYAFLGVFAAALYDYRYVVVGNEYSSNFGNINYKGLEVNHQWSKSFEFEKLFQEYLKTSITPDITYFSLLRPFYEIRIVKMFAQIGKKYFMYFSSCNKNFKIRGALSRRSFSGGGWCGECPKCVFVFILLSAFLPKKQLISIFGKNLYQQEHLLPLFKDIMGVGKLKPFDCVGTFEEAQTALLLAKNTYSKDFIVRHIGRVSANKEVFRTQKEHAIPEEFKFLGMENALILGYGKEGKVTEKYLRKFYPKLKIGIADAGQGSNYLKKQTDFDIAIKTPGINKKLMAIPYTTATNIFFSHVKGRYPVVGVTGSKGKSTTTSLIYAILKAAGKNAVLAGNIGMPMLGELLKPIKKGTIFVLELSSYQLDDIQFSPDIAVVTNLFPEHMDFHGSLQAYYTAKRNIFAFQKPGEHLIDRPTATKKYPSNLLGQHNQNNIEAAVRAVKLLGVNDTAIKKALSTFNGLPHRLENVGTFKGITFYDDAISTTPESTILALEALKGHVDTIFLGGEDRGYKFSKLEKAVRKAGIKNVVLFPNSGKKMFKTTKGLNILHTKSMSEAVQWAYKNTAKNKICLLSCASPSYSLWKNFEEKGDQFKTHVKKHAKAS